MDLHGLTVSEKLHYLSQGELPTEVYSSYMSGWLLEFSRDVLKHIKEIESEAQEEIFSLTSYLNDERLEAYNDGYEIGYDKGYEDGYNKGCFECTGGE